MVQRDRTFSDDIFTGARRRAGYAMHLRTFSNYSLIEIARYIDFFYTRSGWFDSTEPFRTTYSQGCMVPMHLFRVVQPQRTSSNVFEPLQCRESKVCRGLSRAFGVVRLYRTFSNQIFTRGSRCVVYLYTGSGWFNVSDPPRTFLVLYFEV